MRKIGIIILFLAISLSAHAETRQIFTSGSDDPARGSATEYNSVLGESNGTWTTSAGRVDKQQVFPTDGTLRNWYCQVDAAPGSGKSWTFRIELNTVNTSLECTVSDPDTSCSDTSNTIDIAKGDLINIESVPSGSPTDSQVHCSIEFESDTLKETVLTSINRGGIGSTGTRLCVLYGTRGNCGSTVSDADAQTSIMPISGTIKKLYVDRESTPGSGNSITITIQKNASDTALTCTLGESDTVCEDSSNSFTVSEGDELRGKSVTSGSPSTTPNLKISVVLLSDTDGEFPLIATSGADLNDTETRYTWPTGGQYSSSTSETSRDQQGFSMTLKKMFVELLNGSPGSGKSYAFTYRDTAVSTAMTCTVSDTNTTCTDTRDITVAVNDLMSVLIQPSSTPSVRKPAISFKGYIAPTASGSVNQSRPIGKAIMRGVL